MSWPDLDHITPLDLVFGCSLYSKVSLRWQLVVKAHSSSVLWDSSESHSPPVSAYVAQLLLVLTGQTYEWWTQWQQLSAGVRIDFDSSVLGSRLWVWSINLNKRPAWCWMSDEVISAQYAASWCLRSSPCGRMLCYEYEWRDVLFVREFVCVSECVFTHCGGTVWSPPVVLIQTHMLHIEISALMTFYTLDSCGVFPLFQAYTGLNFHYVTTKII